MLRVCYVCVTCARVQLILIRSFFSSKIHTLKYNIYTHTHTQEKPYQISAAAATIMDSAKILKFQLFFPRKVCQLQLRQQYCH